MEHLSQSSSQDEMREKDIHTLNSSVNQTSIPATEALSSLSQSTSTLTPETSIEGSQFASTNDSQNYLQHEHHHVRNGSSNNPSPLKQVRLGSSEHNHAEETNHSSNYPNGNDDDDDDDEDDLKAALALSLQTAANEESQRSLGTSSLIMGDFFDNSVVNPTTYDNTSTVASPTINATSSSSVVIEDVNMKAFHQVMWDTSSTTGMGGVGTTTQEDQSRWISQGILFSSTTDIDFANPHNDHDPQKSHAQLNWGLVQNHGGPCGVLAAIQAEVLKILLFESPKETPFSTSSLSSKTEIQNYIQQLGGDAECMVHCLALAMARILARVAVAKRNENDPSFDASVSKSPRITIVLPSNEKSITDNKNNEEENGDDNIKTPFSSCSTLNISNVHHEGTYTGLEWGSLDPWPWGNAGGNVAKLSGHVLSLPSALNVLDSSDIKRMEEELAQVALAFLKPKMHYFHLAGGVLLFVMSLVETRGAESVKNDMDDPQYSHLTSQFGHCSQELLNLLLTGQATTNVFDHTVDMSGLIIHGISQRPSIGYLSQLESLRYCTVGTYYKTPTYPIWVLGSQSHFTVLFSQDPDVVKESESESVLERCRRVFKGIDNGEENGFIQVSSLGKLLRGLDLEEKVGGESGVNLLAASLEVSGAGIILWDDFWRIAGRLMTGASLENVLQGTDGDSTNSVNAVMSGGGSTLGGDENMAFTESTISYGYETDLTANDEEMAKRLAAEYGTAPPNISSSDQTKTSATKSDEELARELQAQFDAEDNNRRNVENSSSLAPSLFGENIPLSEHTAIIPYTAENNASIVEQTAGKENSAPSTSSSSPPSTTTASATSLSAISENPPSVPSIQQTRHNIEFEKFGETFTLHHYNGLRGGILTSFKVTKLSAEDAVGASVALSQSSSNNAGGPQEYSQRNRSSGDLEDVVRTRWPSCVFNWGESENGGGKVGVSLID